MPIDLAQRFFLTQRRALGCAQIARSIRRQRPFCPVYSATVPITRAVKQMIIHARSAIETGIMNEGGQGAEAAAGCIESPSLPLVNIANSMAQHVTFENKTNSD